MILHPPYLPLSRPTVLLLLRLVVATLATERNGIDLAAATSAAEKSDAQMHWGAAEVPGGYAVKQWDGAPPASSPNS